ncbi:MAG: hypothetical protein R6W48_00480, partial [Gaiellaceae bacterium]
MDELRHDTDEQAAKNGTPDAGRDWPAVAGDLAAAYRQAADPPAVNGGLPESVDETPPVAPAGQQAGALADVTAQQNGVVQEPETVDLDPRAAYLALYPEEETRERRRFGRRSA